MRCIPSAENKDSSVVGARKQVCHKALWEGYDMIAHQFVSSGQLPPPGSLECVCVCVRPGTIRASSHLKGKSTLNQE